MVGLLVAMGYPLPQGDTSSPTTIMAAPAPLRFYTGSASTQDSAGNTWYPDASAPGVAVSGGNLYQLGASIAQDIAAADPAETDPELYENERWGTFKYTISGLIPGFYRLTLKFMEIAYTDDATNTGVRIFNVAINGNTVLNRFDVAGDAGGAFIADDKVFSNVLPVNGKIEISFVGDPEGTDHNAKISAVEIEPQWDGSVPNPYIGESGYASYYSGELQNFYSQLAQLGQQAYASQLTDPLRLRFDGNEMEGLVSPGVLVLAEDLLHNGRISTLMMSGNRISSIIPVPRDDFEFPGACFLATAAVMLATRCVVSGNMILNDEPASGPEGEGKLRPISLLLDYNLFDALNYRSPVPQISVTGNLLAGDALIDPPHYGPNSGVPAPMNSWNFMNTVRA